MRGETFHSRYWGSDWGNPRRASNTPPETCKPHVPLGSAPSASRPPRKNATQRQQQASFFGRCGVAERRTGLSERRARDCRPRHLLGFLLCFLGFPLCLSGSESSKRSGRKSWREDRVCNQRIALQSDKVVSVLYLSPSSSLSLSPSESRPVLFLVFARIHMSYPTVVCPNVLARSPFLPILCLLVLFPEIPLLCASLVSITVSALKCILTPSGALEAHRTSPATT